MQLALYTHASCLRHEPGAGHPESPARLKAVLEALDTDRFAGVDRIEAPRATREQLLRAHSPGQVEAVFAQAPQEGDVRIDADTVMSTGSLEAALRAAGAVCAAVDAVIDAQHERAFCAVRPPGHHATHAQAMGFCLFNNVAIGATHALARGLQRVAIVDFDVHHGNGSQDIFENEARVLYASTHEMPLYPGSGLRRETGVGNIVNEPLPSGGGSGEFRTAYRERILPALNAFKPQLLLISAGFDAHKLDPLANLNLDAEDYAWVTQELLDIARKHARGRVVSTLEGGYSLTALRQSVQAHVAALLD
ncbi:acetoin utilization deacetylase AcuC-like enzyme [Tahibacter aquaticus]|uniref:Acetoin utilization deacetylase AcuC-like enzyme n=1 Tax=Tahibacter aquaticus TaxID=520092 RepID=A0A4R6YPR7_9GAMM|nr:histone deacetylase family protein [Tahibacter aquaticus]TDR39762.1 acetoin utilization deacetylase AcuC-like enzyme [Tahibacter aquaticus]